VGCVPKQFPDTPPHGKPARTGVAHHTQGAEMSEPTSAVSERGDGPVDRAAWAAAIDPAAALEAWADQPRRHYQLTCSAGYSPVVYLRDDTRQVVVNRFDLPDSEKCTLAALIRLALEQWREGEKRLVSVDAPDGFPFESLPPQGRVFLTYSDGAAERRVMTEQQYRELRAKMEAGQ